MKYKIKKGKYPHSNLFARIWFLNFNNSMTRECSINTGWYNTKKFGMFMNKLFGMAYYNPEDTSGRIGWKPATIEGYYNIYTFTHDNTILLLSVRLCTVRQGEKFIAKVKKLKGGYLYSVTYDGETHVKLVNVEYPKGFIRCYPFAGWKNKNIGAPVEVNVELKKAK